MLETIKRFFQEHLAGEPADGADLEHRLQLATAALLIEASRADDTQAAAERRAIERGIADKFGLTAAETAELVALAEEEARQAVSDFDFVTLINRHFTAGQKLRIVELLWQVAYADGHLDKHQEHYIRRLAELLHVPHRAFIAAKLRAQPPAH